MWLRSEICGRGPPEQIGVRVPVTYNMVILAYVGSESLLGVSGCLALRVQSPLAV